MKKIINKIRNIFITVGVVLLAGTTKVFGVRTATEYGIPATPDLYGVEKPVKLTNKAINLIKILKLFIIPIAFIIGSIIYLKKSKTSKKRKIITLIIALVLVVAIYFGINYIINK